MPTANPPAPPAGPPPDAPPGPAVPVLTPAQWAALLDSLSLPSDPPPAPAVLLAVAKDLADENVTLRRRVAELEKSRGPGPDVAAARAAGLEMIDAATLASLRAEAEKGRALAASVARREVELAVDAAIGEGKVTPARRGHWVTLVTADPEMGKVLASLPAGLAVPLTPVGHAVGNEWDQIDPAAPAAGAWVV